MSEMNPNHAMTAAVRDQWHKLCAILLHKLTDGHAVLTLGDIDGLVKRFDSDGMPAIAVQETARGIELTLVSGKEAERLARQHGGLPQ